MICLHSSHKNSKIGLILIAICCQTTIMGVFSLSQMSSNSLRDDLPLNSSGASERTSQPPLVVDTVLSLPELVNKAVYTV